MTFYSNWGVERINNIRYINKVEKLPTPVGGTHTLKDNTAYFFTGFVSSQNSLELGTNTPLLGSHGAVDGFIYTGGGTAIQGNGAGFFARDMTFMAPGGTMFDLTGDQTTEMLVESCSFADPANLGNIADLGTIDGLRVPTFKGCNFEDYNAGITFTGTPDKIFFSECPFRGVTQSGVDTITLSGTLDVDIVDLPGNYGKDWQSDTTFVHTESGGEPTDVLQITGTTFDGSVSKSEVLTGTLDKTSVGVNVKESWPIADSNSGISYSKDGTTTTNIINQDPGDGSEAVKITGPTTEFSSATERFTHASPNQATYTGRRTFKEKASGTVSISGSNTTAAVYFAKNGSVLNRSGIEITTASAGQPRAVSLASRIEFEPNDTLEVYLANEGGTGDLEVSTLEVTI